MLYWTVQLSLPHVRRNPFVCQPLVFRDFSLVNRYTHTHNFPEATKHPDLTPTKTEDRPEQIEGRLKPAKQKVKQ